MKNIVKKMTGLIMASVLVIGTAGCGDTSEVSDDGQTNEEDAALEETAAGQESSSGEGNDAAEKVTVRIGCVGQNDVLSDALGIAQEKGFLDEEMADAGYDVEVIGFAQAGPAINEAFVADEIDIAIYGDMPAVTLKASGGDTTVFAVDNDQMQMAVLVQEDSGISSAADLAGHTVIVAIGTIYQEYFKNIIEEAGVDESDIEQINTFTDASSLMASGDADALITSTSTAYYMEEQGIGKVVQTSEETPEMTAQFFAVGRTEFLEENPEAAKALIKAALRGLDYMRENQEECYELFSERSDGYSVSIYEKIYAYDESYVYLEPAFDEDNTERLQELVDFMLEEALISTDVDVESFIDTSYVQEAVAEYETENEGQ